MSPLRTRIGCRAAHGAGARAGPARGGRRRVPARAGSGGRGGGTLGPPTPAARAQPAVRVPLAGVRARHLHDLPGGVHGVRGGRGEVARARVQGVPHGHRVLLRVRHARRDARLDPADPPRDAAALAAVSRSYLAFRIRLIIYKSLRAGRGYRVLTILIPDRLVEPLLGNGLL